MRKMLPESSHGLGEPKQDLRVVSHRAPNDALNDMVLTSGYAEDLENALMEVWGRREKWRGGGADPGCYKAGCRRAWTVNCTTSVSEAHAVSV